MTFPKAMDDDVSTWPLALPLVVLAAILASCSSPTVTMPAPIVVSCENYKQLSAEETRAVAAAIDALDDEIKSATRAGTVSVMAPLTGPLLEWRKHSLGAAMCHKMDMRHFAAAGK